MEFLTKDCGITGSSNDSQEKIKRSEWIKCTTELPDRDDTFLTSIMDNGCNYSLKIQKFAVKPRLLQGPYGDKRSHWEIETWDDYITTHWMELPEFPNLT